MFAVKIVGSLLMWIIQRAIAESYFTRALTMQNEPVYKRIGDWV